MSIKQRVMAAKQAVSQAEETARRAAAELALAETIKKRNDQFRKLPLARQRVVIAKDVLAQLATGRLVAGSTYLDIMKQPVSVSSYDQLCDVRDKLKCQACGIGSLMVAACGFVDNLTISEADGMGQSGIQDYLSDWFTEDQLALIERWFETRTDGMVVGDAYCVDEPPKDHPIMKFRSARGRLTAIMENIISNRGTFDPTRGKHKGPL